MKDNKIVMAFGVFDVIHDGHRYFFAEAGKLGAKFVVVLATDGNVRRLKKHSPVNSLPRRMDNLKGEFDIDEVISGDEILGSWTAVSKFKPDVIALGYDQAELADSLKRFVAENGLGTEFVIIKPYKNGLIHSSNTGALSR